MFVVYTKYFSVYLNYTLNTLYHTLYVKNEQCLSFTLNILVNILVIH